MIRPARKMLKALRSIVKTEDDVIFIAYQDKTLSLVHNANTPTISIPFPVKDPSPQGTIKALEHDGYISIREDYGFQYCTLTYKAFHKRRLLLEDIRSFVIRSIIIPISVSIVTTLIILLLQSW